MACANETIDDVNTPPPPFSLPPFLHVSRRKSVRRHFTDDCSRTLFFCKIVSKYCRCKYGGKGSGSSVQFPCYHVAKKKTKKKQCFSSCSSRHWLTLTAIISDANTRWENLQLASSYCTIEAVIPNYILECKLNVNSATQLHSKTWYCWPLILLWTRALARDLLYLITPSFGTSCRVVTAG